MEIKEKPIIMQRESVIAILASRKTQTRRVMKPQPAQTSAGLWWPSEAHKKGLVYQQESAFKEWVARDFGGGPYGQPGDKLWVREAFALIWPEDYEPEDIKECKVEYKADGAPERLPGDWPDEYGGSQGKGDVPRWQPSIHMPRWASRITLEVVNVRAERLQDISEKDALAEGMSLYHGWQTPEYKKAVAEAEQYSRNNKPPWPAPPLGLSLRERYRHLWDSLNSKRGFGWDTNPWVWVVEFKVVEE